MGLTDRLEEGVGEVLRLEDRVGDILLLTERVTEALLLLERVWDAVGVMEALTLSDSVRVLVREGELVVEEEMLAVTVALAVSVLLMLGLKLTLALTVPEAVKLGVTVGEEEGQRERITNCVPVTKGKGCVGTVKVGVVYCEMPAMNLTLLTMPWNLPPLKSPSLKL